MLITSWHKNGCLSCVCVGTVHRDMRPSVACDAAFCHGCRKMAVIWKPHREWHLIDGNEKSYEITTGKPSPSVVALGVICIPNRTVISIFPTLIFNHVMKYLLDEKRKSFDYLWNKGLHKSLKSHYSSSIFGVLSKVLILSGNQVSNEMLKIIISIAFHILNICK